MGIHNGSIHTTHTPPPLSFYNTFKNQCSGSVGNVLKHILKDPVSTLFLGGFQDSKQN
jgi:hypothetical protein